jgi:hypothetical protein
MNKIIIFTILALFPLFCNAQTTSESTAIVGNWVSEGDSNWTISFSAKNVYVQYYEGNVIETGLYSILSAIPQTNPPFPVGSNISYLKLLNTSTQNAQYYEINGITATNLSIMWITNGNIIIFDRQ